jgi:23S rRNA (adenine2030-N6)-methyltransferase
MAGLLTGANVGRRGDVPLNYRHAFHAGNFADLLKHAVLTELLARLTMATGPLTVIDCHAGAGIYDLASEAARKTGEGAAGIGVLMADTGAPAAFDALKAAVGRLAVAGRALYPGSPDLIARALRPGDALIACESRADDFAALDARLKGRRGALALNADGWRAAERRMPVAPARALVLIDPPYELGDDADRTVATTERLLSANPGAVIAAWAPIKDLASFDALLGGLEEAASERPVVVAQVRLRALDDPMRLNGCAMVVVSAPPGIEGPSDAAAAWIASALGEKNAVGRARRVGS